MTGAGTIFFAYIGFDAVSTAAQEAGIRSATCPSASSARWLICTVLYVLFSHVLTGMVSYTELGVAAPVAVAIDKTPYVWLNYLVKFGIICGFTSVILVMLLGQSRVFYLDVARRPGAQGLLADPSASSTRPGAPTCCS